MRDPAPRAAAVARAISRLLKAAGADISVKENKHRRTEGYRISRVVFSGTISVDYHMRLFTQEERERRAFKVAFARDFLTRRGYRLDPSFNQGTSLYIDSREESKKVKPKCPVCGAPMRRCKSGDPGCLHCTKDTCDGFREPKRGI